MPEANTQTAKPKSKPQAPPFAGSVFHGVEAPAAFRDMAEKSLSQAKDNYEKMKSAAEEATGVLEDTYASASKGAADYSLKVIEVARINTNAAFDFAAELFAAKSISEVIELSTAHARHQFETLSAQTKELATLAQKVATEAAEPMKEGMTKAAKKVG
jgi:phasin